MPSKYLKIKNILPREDDKIMSGYFGLVAIWVTQPLWPHNVPRSFKVSVILKKCLPAATYTQHDRLRKERIEETEIDWSAHVNVNLTFHVFFKGRP